MPRRRRGGIAAWLSETSTPVFVLDARRVVLFFNRGCEALTGWSAAEVVGRVCQYHAPAEPTNIEALTGRLAPPPEVLAGQAAVVPTLFLKRDGTTAPCDIHYSALPGATDRDWHLLGVCVPPAPRPADAEDWSPPRLHAELAALRVEMRQRYQLDRLVAHSPGMRRVADQLQLAALTEAPVFLMGESGTGRTFLARLIHQASRRRAQAFVPLDCAVLTEAELERTLRRLLGLEPRNDAADAAEAPGVVCLQRVSLLPRDLQRLVLDELERPATIVALPRVLATDDKPPRESVEAGRLLPELACRLTPLVIELPPLRERREELPYLVQLRLEELNAAGERQVGGCSQDVLEEFLRYGWPGNVRELDAVVGEAHAAAVGPIVTLRDLPFRFRSGLDAQRVSPAPPARTLDLAAYLEAIERQEIQRVLEECRQNRALAARRLGLTRARLYRRMQQLGLTVPTDVAAADETDPDTAADAE